MSKPVDLVMLPGWGTSRRVFDPLADALARVLRTQQINLPGHGDAVNFTVNATLESWANAALDQAQATTWLGWSLGGQVAMSAALGHPQWVRRLVLFACSASFVSRPDWPRGMDKAALERFIDQVKSSPRAALSRFNGWQVAGSERAITALRFLESLADEEMAGERALVDGLAILRDTDLRSGLDQLQIPVLVVAGTEDRVVSIEAVRKTVALIPHAVLKEIPGAGHAAFLSHQEQVVAAVLEFLQAEKAA